MKRIDEASTTQALKLLMQDHRRIRRLLRLAEETPPPVRARAASLACRELEAHAALEEHLLYPRLRAAEGDSDGTREALYEHDVARQLVAALDALGAADGAFLPTLQELADWVEAHVEHEEQRLLTQAKQVDLDLSVLAEALLERQRTGALTDVDVDAEASSRHAHSDAQPLSVGSDAYDRQRTRMPGRRGAH